MLLRSPRFQKTHRARVLGGSSGGGRRTSASPVCDDKGPEAGGTADVAVFLGGGAAGSVSRV